MKRRLSIEFFETFSMIAVAIAILLIYLMQCFGNLRVHYYSTRFSTYGNVLDIGFRPSAILGMIGVIIIQLAMYFAVMCNKNWKIYICAFGFILYNEMIFRDICVDSLNYIGYKIGTGMSFWFPFEYRRDIFIYIVIVVTAIMMIVRLLSMDKYYYEKKGSRFWQVVGLVFSGLLAVVGFVILLFQTFTHPWYPILCLVTSVVSWVLLKQTGIFWSVRGPSRISLGRKESLLDRLLLKFPLFEDDESDGE